MDPVKYGSGHTLGRGEVLRRELKNSG